jgi:hypothetical protein
LAQTTYTLTTFIEPDPEDAAVPDRYLAGFRDADGEPWGLIVPLDGDDVRRELGLKSGGGPSQCTRSTA